MNQLMTFQASNRSEQSNYTTAYPRIGQDIIDASLAFELGIPEIDDDDLRRKLFEFRPSLEEATRLCEIYLDYGQFLYVFFANVPVVISETSTRWKGIPREELIREVLSPAYAFQ